MAGSDMVTMRQEARSIRSRASCLSKRCMVRGIDAHLFDLKSDIKICMKLHPMQQYKQA